MKSINYVLTLLIGVVFIAVLILPHFITMPESEGDTYVMTFRELGEDWSKKPHKFKSLNAGDTVKIEDKIVDIIEEKCQTKLVFEGAFVIIKAEVADEYNIGDDVIIELTLKFYEDVQYGYNFIWFEEDLDGPFGNIVLSPSTIERG